MNEVINEKVSVELIYNRMTGLVMPRRMRWQGRLYIMKKLGYYHKVRQGRTILHIFHVTDGNTDFRLSLDTENLHWTLNEITDGTTT
jgi:hypothetical protein